MKTDLEVLKEARSLIEKPEHWQQGEYWNDEMTCFCSAGAVAHVLGVAGIDAENRSSPVQILGGAAQDLFGYSEGIVRFNDGHSHEEVLRCFDRAIAQLERQS